MTGTASRRHFNHQKEVFAMAYTTKNYRTKKALKEAVSNGERVTVFQPNSDLFGMNAPDVLLNGIVTLEGPHYPEPHRWYAKAELKEGVVIKVS